MSQPLSLTITTTTTTTTTVHRQANLQLCQRCDEESVFTRAYMAQECLKCGFRPNVDCFKCDKNGCLSGDAVRIPLHCLECGWSAPDNQIHIDSEPVYEGDPDEPVAMD